MEGVITKSQLALLVYDYLKKESSPAAANSFTETSKHMEDDARKNLIRGRRVNILVNGLGLSDMIDILNELVCYVHSLECSPSEKCEQIVEQLRSILKLRTCSPEESALKPVYLHFTVKPKAFEKATFQTPNNNKTDEPIPTLQSPNSSPETISPRVDGTVTSTAKLQKQFHVLLENKALHEKLAENINKVVASKSESESLESILQKKIVETILNDTEQDPFFQEMLEELVGPAEVAITPDDNEHENDDAGTNGSCTPSDGSVEEPEVQSPCLEPDPTTNSTKLDPQAAVLPSVQTPYAIMAVDSAPAKSDENFGSPVSTTPFVAQQPFLPAQSAVASTICVPATTQNPPGYVMSPRPAALSSLVTPQIVIGQTFQGTVLRFTPSGPRIRHFPHSGLSPPPPPVPSRLASKIQVLDSTPCSSTLRTVLPKPTPTAQGPKPTPIFQVPVNQGNQSPQDVVATVSLAPSASPVLPSAVVKRGARTRGGKVRAYPGRKKIVQTIGPATIGDRPGPSPTPVDECTTTGGSSEKSKLSVKQSQGKPIKADSCSQAACVVTDPCVDDGVTQPSSEQAVVPESSSETDKPAADVSKPDEIPVDSDTVSATAAGADEKPTVLVPKPQVESKDPEQEVTRTETRSPTDSTQQETANPVAPQPDAAAPGRSSSRRDTVSCRTEATPQQDSEPRVRLRKRLSLSSPRRGSHVRTLEFKTPPKNATGARKSFSSPKNRAPDTRHPEMQRMLESVKKGELFKSPPTKEKKSWDADLRQYTAEEDIPTSVGLKRNVKASRTKSAAKSKQDPSNSDSDDPKGTDTSKNAVDTTSNEKSPKKIEGATLERKSESDDDLVSRIRRDVLDVIGEEDVADLSAATLCVDKSSDIVECLKSSPKSVKSPVRSPGTSSVLEIGDIGLSASTIKQLYRRATSVDESSCTMDSPSKAPKNVSSPMRTHIEANKEHLLASPVRSAVESAKASTPSMDLDLQLQLTPSPSSKFIANVGSTPPDHNHSGSLEATLINECRRIENEGLETARDSSDSKSSDSAPKPASNPDVTPSVSSSKTATTAGKSGNPVSSLNILPPIGITPLKTPGKALLASVITPLKTPAKPPPSAPVEMTPLSKIINEETRLAKCTLLTPTIPPTPDYEEVKKQSPTADAVSPPSADKKTAQSKINPSPAIVKIPSPRQKLHNTLPKSAPKTLVVNLTKPVEKTPKTRRKKLPVMKSSRERLIDELVEEAQNRIRFSSSPQDGVASEPVEFPQKKKTPKRKKKEEPDSGVKPGRKKKKEPDAGVKPKIKSKTNSKLPHFQTLLESYEKSVIGMSSSSEDENVADPKPPGVLSPTMMSDTPKTKSKGKGTKKTTPKEASQSSTSKKRAPKKNSKKTDNKPPIEENNDEDLTDKDLEKGNQPASHPNGGTAVRSSVNSKEVPAPSSTVTWVNKSSQNVFIPSLKESKTCSPTQGVDKGSKQPSPPGGKDEKPTSESTTQNTRALLPVPAAQCSTPNPRKVVTDDLPAPQSPSEPRGSSISTNCSNEVNLDTFSVAIPIVVNGVQTKVHLRCPPYFTFSKPSPCLRRRSEFSFQSSEEDEPSQKPSKKSFQESKESPRTRRRSMSSCSSEREKPPRKPRRSVSWADKEYAAETSKGRRVPPKCSSSSEDDRSPKKPTKSTNVRSSETGNIADPSRRRRARSSSSSDSEEDKWSRKPANARSIKAEEVAHPSRRRRIRSRSSSGSEDGNWSRKPAKSSSFTSVRPEGVVDTSKRRRRRSRSRSSSDERRKRRRIEEKRNTGWHRTPGRFRDGIGRSSRRFHPRSPHSRYLHHPGHRFSNSDDERSWKKTTTKSPYPGRRDRSKSRSRERGERPKSRHDELKKPREDAKRNHDGSKEREHTRYEGSSKTRIQEPTKDSSISDIRETTQMPIIHLDRLSSTVDEPLAIVKRIKSENGTDEHPLRTTRTNMDELEEGEITEESRNTIFQLSKNSPPAGVGTDRLSSPVASVSRQKLLKNVNVDKFLSLVHGEAKTPVSEEEEPKL